MSNGGVNGDILGIQVHYCDGDQRKQIWLDLGKMEAIAWTSDAVGSKSPGPWDPTKSPPKTNAPTGDCKKTLEDGGPFCWWDGTDWICGEL